MSSNELPPIEYRRLGKSGLRVSVPIVGAMSFGSKKWASWVIEEEEALKILKAAWDRGINTIDTANAYSNGESERIIAKFIKKYNIPRHRILIFTKCHFLTHDEVGTVVEQNPGLRDSRDYVNQWGLSRAAIFNQVEASLARLETPYIDLLQIHRYDPATPPEETMRALHDLVVSGRVRYIGASSMRTWQFAELNRVAEINGWTPFISMQNEYSLLYREEEREMIPYCNAKGIGLIPWGPLHRGDLARYPGVSTLRGEATKGTAYERSLSEMDQAIILRVQEIAEKRGWTMAQVALAWIKKRVSSPIIGMSSVERLEEAIRSSSALTDEEERYLQGLYVPKAVRGHA